MEFILTALLVGGQVFVKASIGLLLVIAVGDGISRLFHKRQCMSKRV